MLKKLVNDELFLLGLLVTVISGFLVLRLLVQEPHASPEIPMFPPPPPPPAADAPKPNDDYRALTAALAKAPVDNKLGEAIVPKIKGQWMVDRTGKHEFDTVSISQAVQFAAPGDVIQIYPGTYVENLVLMKDVTIVGLPGPDGKPAVTIEGSNSPNAAIFIARGHVRMQFINVSKSNFGSSNPTAAIMIYGGQTILQYLKVQSAGGSALIVANNGDVLAEKSSFSGSHRGIDQTGGKLSCNDCVTSNNSETGIIVSSVSSTAEANFHNLVANKNARNAVEIREGVHSRIDGCRVSENMASGIEIGARAYVMMTDCTFAQNAYRGLWIGDDTNVSIKNSLIAENGEGIFLRHPANVQIEDTAINGNENYGINYMNMEHVSLTKTTFKDNKMGEKRITNSK